MNRFDIFAESYGDYPAADLVKIFLIKQQNLPEVVIIKIIFMGVWNQVAQYLFLKKKDPDAPKSQWIGYMHGINRISILLFLAGLVILAIKLLRR